MQISFQLPAARSRLCRFCRASFLSMEHEVRIDLTAESTETTEMWFALLPDLSLESHRVRSGVALNFDFYP